MQLLIKNFLSSSFLNFNISTTKRNWRRIRYSGNRNWIFVMINFNTVWNFYPTLPNKCFIWFTQCNFVRQKKKTLNFCTSEVLKTKMWQNWWQHKRRSQKKKQMMTKKPVFRSWFVFPSSAAFYHRKMRKKERRKQKNKSLYSTEYVHKLFFLAIIAFKRNFKTKKDFIETRGFFFSRTSNFKLILNVCLKCVANFKNCIILQFVNSVFCEAIENVSAIRF